MKRSKLIGIGSAALFVALWVVPLARAISFVRWAQEYFREDGTVNASNDLHYSVWLLACYAASLILAFAFAWLLYRRFRVILLLPGALLAFAACKVMWLHPEEPIALFPTMWPWYPVLISLVALAIAVLFFYFPLTARYKGNT